MKLVLLNCDDCANSILVGGEMRRYATCVREVRWREHHQAKVAPAFVVST